MLKYVFTILIILVCNTAFAANQVGVILIGSSDYKDAHFMSQMEDIFQSDASGKFTIHVGNEEQARSQE